MLQSSTIRFIKDLKLNNNKPWFEEHRSDYEESKNDFEQFIGHILNGYAKKDPDIGNLKARECTFRINRDVRFSKDKSPYKTNIGAYINRGGKKSIFAGYYFHVEPGQSIVGGGAWMPAAPDLKKIRQEIDYCFDEFRQIISSPKFKAVYGDLEKTSEYSLVNVPKGYEKDNPAADYLKLKSCVAIRSISDAELTSKTLASKIIESFETLKPLIKFLNRSLEG